MSTANRGVCYNDEADSHENTQIKSCPRSLREAFRLANSSVHAYLFHMRVEGDRHVQQDFALLHAANKVLDSVFELVGGLVDLFWVALSRLGQLLGRLEQLVRIGVSVLRGD